MARSIISCPICARLPQKSSGDRLPDGAEALVEAPASTRRCPECETFYSYSEDHDPGEPMVPATDTYTLIRLTPVLTRAELESAPADQKPGAQLWLDVLARGWAMSHDTLRAAASMRPPSPHIARYIVESLTDFYLDKGDRDAFQRTLLESPQAVIRAHAGTDFLFVATEEYPVWTVRAFSKYQQRLAASWLEDATFTRSILETLASCLDQDDPAVGIDAVLGERRLRACVVAYEGLSNAIHRKLDLSPVMPTLQKLAAGRNADHRSLAIRLLDDLGKQS